MEEASQEEAEKTPWGQRCCWGGRGRGSGSVLQPPRQWQLQGRSSNPNQAPDSLQRQPPCCHPSPAVQSFHLLFPRGHCPPRSFWCITSPPGICFKVTFSVRPPRPHSDMLTPLPTFFQSHFNHLLTYCVSGLCPAPSPPADPDRVGLYWGLGGCSRSFLPLQKPYPSLR